MDQAKGRLIEAFSQTLSPDPGVIKQVEVFLKAQAQTPGYTISVLQLLSPDVPVEIRQAAAVNFKNHVKAHWVPKNDDSVTDQTVIPDAEKEEVKKLLLDFMLSTPPLIRAQLSEALAVISSYDFPARWQSLLPALIEKLKEPAADVERTYGVLETANAVFKRYRAQFMSNNLSEDLAYSQQFIEPLLHTLTVLVTQITGTPPGGDVKLLQRLVLAARLACRTFLSLNSPGLTQAFEDSLGAWMAQFHTLLVYENPALAESQPDKEASLDAAKAAVCANINLFLEINDDEFGPFVETFVQDVWTQLVNVSLSPGLDNLAMAAIRFLTTVAAGIHHTLFRNEGVLRQVCEKIVLPNLRITQDIQEVFEMNHVEYIRRDTEGNDFDTRRRAATELVRGLTAKFPQEVTQLFSQYVLQELQAYAKDPAQAWSNKDVAIYLVTALTVQGKTAAEGATTTNQLVHIGDFFNQHIIPALQSPAAGGADSGEAVLTADALKFLTTFRSQLPRETLINLFPKLVEALGSPSNVVHSYAAICIERLLVSREAGQPRFRMADLSPVLQSLLERLFAAFQLDDSHENEYVMKCVCRVIVFVGPEIASVAAICLQYLSQLLLEVCKNPSQPSFNHYIFESVAALIKNSASQDSNRIAELEQQLFPAFNTVLQNDVQEFHPYVFQIFAQLIELRPIPLPPVYMELFPPLLSPLFWERPANITPLVRLLQAYLCKAGKDIVQRGHLQGVLGVFQKLISSKAHDHEGFYILNSLLEYLPMELYQQYLPNIWSLLFRRLQDSKTAKFSRAFVVFLAFFIVQQGVSSVALSVEKVQAGLFAVLMNNIWLPAMMTVSGKYEEKLVTVATTKVLCDPALQSQPPVWGALLKALVGFLQQKRAGAEVGGGDQEADELAAEGGGYSSAYARLAYAAKTDPDPLPGVQDPPHFFATKLAEFSQAHPGQVLNLIREHLPQNLQTALQELCTASKVEIK